MFPCQTLPNLFEPLVGFCGTLLLPTFAYPVRQTALVSCQNPRTNRSKNFGGACTGEFINIPNALAVLISNGPVISKEPC